VQANDVTSTLMLMTMMMMMTTRRRHAQVRYDGSVHALTPLGYPLGGEQGRCVIVTRPATFLSALWLPFARDPTEMIDVLQAIQTVRKDATAGFKCLPGWHVLDWIGRRLSPEP
jgi:hypothetical protein